jgi:hypothetical protein
VIVLCKIRSSQERKVLVMFGTYKYTRMYSGYIVILFSLQVRNAVRNLLCNCVLALRSVIGSRKE